MAGVGPALACVAPLTGHTGSAGGTASGGTPTTCSPRTRSAPQPVANTGSGAGPDSFTLTRVDASTLDSAALRNGAVVAYARRVVSADGSLLAVVQEGPHPEGGAFAISRSIGAFLRTITAPDRSTPQRAKRAGATEALRVWQDQGAPRTPVDGRAPPHRPKH